nr:MAG: DNA pilot protein [Microviridae sp.]
MGMLDGLFKVGETLVGGIPGIGPLLSGGLGAIQGMYDTQQASDAQAHAEEREDNSVQRRVADLRAAGLAPQLGASGASSSSGGIRVDSAGNEGDPMQDATDAATRKKAAEDAATRNAVALMSQKADISKSTADAALATEQARAARIQNNVNEAPMMTESGIRTRASVKWDQDNANSQASALQANARAAYADKLSALNGARLTDQEYQNRVDKIEAEYAEASAQYAQPTLGPHTLLNVGGGHIMGAARDLLGGLIP